MPRDPKRRQKNIPTDERIPRPANCFMIFRADWLRSSIANSIRENCGRQKQKDVSQEAAAAWNNLSPTLKQLYKVQADIVKEEHSKKYPGWTYQPRAMRRRSSVVDDVAPYGSPTKRVARGHTVTPHQKSSTDAEGKQNATAIPFTPITAQTGLVWDRSWFSGSSSMKDPFYSAALQPLASSSAAPPIVPAHPPFFLPPSQVHGFGMAPNFLAMSSLYHHNDGLRNLERHGHNALPPTNHALDLLDFRSLPQATAPAEPLASSGHPTSPPSPTGDSTPTAGSSTGEVPTPVQEAEPPTQSLVGSSDLIYDKFLEGYYNNNDWEANSAFNPDFDLFSTTEL